MLALSLAGSGLGLLLQGLAVALGWPLRAFLWLRVLTGSCAGASPVAKAYLADIGQATGRLPSYMAWRDAASTGAFIVGPALSGQLYAAIKAASSQQLSLATIIGAAGIGKFLYANQDDASVFGAGNVDGHNIGARHHDIMYGTVS